MSFLSTSITPYQIINIVKFYLHFIQLSLLILTESRIDFQLYILNI